MVVEPMRDRRAERREATKTGILDAAWEMVRAEGVGGLPLGGPPRRVGMQAPSLYSYFDSKHAIYDAMFLQGNLELLRRYEAMPAFDDPVDEFRANARMFVGFTVEDPARAQLMFMRSIPGFEPSPESYEVAVRIVDYGRARFKTLGVTKAEHFDLWTGIISGLSFQQIANEPGTERWAR